MKFPAKLGACIDLLYAARSERLELQREMDEKLESLKAKEAAIKDHIIESFDKQDIEGAKGSIAVAAVKRSVKYRPEDFLAVWAWAKKNDAPDLFEKRLSQTAVRERLEQGAAIPGVESFTVLDLSLTKISKK